MDTEETIELYGAQTGNCWRAAIALEEAAIPYQARLVELHLGEHRQSEFLGLNAAGKVPVLVGRSTAQPFVLTQSNAIVLFAAEKARGKLLPDEDPHLRALAYERFFYFVTDVIAVSHSLQSLRGLTHKSSSQLLSTRLVAALGFADRFVSTSQFMAGDKFSIADIAAVTITANLAEYLDWQHLPNLQRWFKEVVDRPSVVRGMNAFAR